jgi:hypothetical protein
LTGESSHLPQGGKEPPNDQDRDRHIRRRFDLHALPSRRATYILKVVSVALPALALLAIGLFAVSEWLALRPVVRATPTLPVLSYELATPTLASVTTGAAAAPFTPLPTMTSTLTPRPTNTLVPLRTRTPRPAPTPTSPSTVRALLPAPALIDPADGATPPNRVTFRWEWNGPPLGDNQAFDLRIWSEQEEQQGLPRRGAVAPTRDTQVEVNLTSVPAIESYGPGTFYWTVIVVEIQPGGPPKEIGQWGQVWRLVYQ